MFASSPFLSAAEQFAGEAVVQFHAAGSVIEQTTEGDLRAIVRCHPTRPPSPHGYLAAEFTGPAGMQADLEIARDVSAEEGTDWIPEHGPTVSYILRYRSGAPLGSRADADEAAARVWDALQPYASPSGLALVDLRERIARPPHGLGSLLGSEIRRSITLDAELHRELSVRDLLSADWAAEAARARDLCSVLSAAATGLPPAPAGSFEDLLR